MWRLFLLSLVVWELPCIQIEHKHPDKPGERTKSVFEYGTRVEDDELSLLHTESIPPFQSVYIIDVTHNITHLEPDYTYLKVEYVQPISRVHVEFDWKKKIVTINQKFPLVTLNVDIIGYSMPRKTT